MAAHLHEKHFTLEQARKMLTGIAHLVEEVVRLKRALDEKGYDISRHVYFGGRGPNGTGTYPAELTRLIRIIRDLRRKGIFIKSLDEGLIDFPSLRSNNEEVYLCWKIGEKSIDYWHPITEGFSGRRPVKEL